MLSGARVEAGISPATFFSEICPCRKRELSRSRGKAEGEGKKKGPKNSLKQNRVTRENTRLASRERRGGYRRGENRLK